MDTKQADKILTEARERFERVSARESDFRTEAAEDLRMLTGDQWDDAVKDARQKEGRPCLTINRLPSIINQVINDGRQNRPSIRVRPVDSGADIETADVLSGLIRDIEHRSGADAAYDTALQYSSSTGRGFLRVVTEYESDATFNQIIRIERVPNPDAIYLDPEYQEADASDIRYAFVCDWIERDEFKRRYPKKEESSFDAGDAAHEGWHQDGKIRVAEYWCVKEEPENLILLANGEVLSEADYKPIAESLNVLDDELREGLVEKSRREVMRRRVVTYLLAGGSQILEGPTEWPGRYIPIVPVFGTEWTVDGERILSGLVRDARDPQRLYNYSRSAATELVALAPKAPFIGTAKQFETYETLWASANTQSLPYLPYNPDPLAPGAPQRQPFAGVPSGAVNEALTAADDLKATTGIYDASIGAQGNETSGRAILARQREGDTGTFHYIDNLARAIRHTGRIIVDLIPHIYDTERVVRLLREDGETEQATLAPGAGPQPDDDMDLRRRVERIFDPQTGRYDVAVDVGPSYTTRRLEAADSMMQFLQAFPAAAPMIGDLVAKAMDWPGASDIADRLRKMLPPGVDDSDDAAPPQPPQPDPETLLKMQKAEIDAAKAQADIAKTEASTQGQTLENQRAMMELAAMNGDLESMIGDLVERKVAGVLQQILGGGAQTAPMEPPGMMPGMYDPNGTPSGV